MARTLNSLAMEDAAPALSARTRTLLILLLAGACGVIGGGLSASGKPQLTGIFFGLVLVILVISSRNAVFWCVVLGGLVVAGACQLYLPGSRYIRYIVPMASAPLLLHWIIDYFKAMHRPREPDVSLPPLLWWAFVFALSGLVSVVVNLSDPMIALVGMKDYFQMWAFFLGVVFLRWSPSFERNIWRGLLLIGLLQIPFAAHQHFYLVPQRMGLSLQGVVPADVVAGTFGAYLFGGGANAVLAAFQVILVGTLLALWKSGSISLMRAAVLSVVMLTPMLVNEAKIAVVYLVLVFCIVFRQDIVARPVRFLGAGLGMFGVVAVLVAGIMLAQPSGKFHSWTDLVDYIVERQTADSHEREGPYSELTRVTSLTFWAKEHVAANPINTLFGHGLGQCREPQAGQEGVLSGAMTLAEKRYTGLNIGYTALSSLLWDTGVIGVTLVLCMFASAFKTAGWLSRYYTGKDRFKAGLFEGLQAAMAVLTLSLAHKDFFVVHLPFQTFVYLLIGLIGYTRLQVARSEAQGRTA